MPDRGLSHLDPPSRFPRKTFLIPSEVDFAGGPVMVSAGFSEASFSSEAFDEVFDVWYLFELSDHAGAEVPFGVVLYWSSGALFVEAGPEGGMDGC